MKSSIRLVLIFLLLLSARFTAHLQSFETAEDLRGYDVRLKFDSKPDYTVRYVPHTNHYVFRLKNTDSPSLKGRQGLSHLLAISFHVKDKGNDLELLVYPRGYFGLIHTWDEASKILKIRFKNGYPTREDLDPERKLKIVCIDPGHGGHDPGAQGGRTKEKELALAMARELRDVINSKDGFKAFLTREKDYKIQLEDRPRISDRAEASIFVSLHLNASIPKVHGFEVFYLSDKGATQTLEKNLEDGTLKSEVEHPGVPEQSQDIVRQILLDMQQVETMNSSSLLANTVAASLKETGRRSRGVRRAAFVVLKTLNTPSILIEMGYITNPSEEAYFADSGKRKEFAGKIARGIQEFLSVPLEHLSSGNSPTSMVNPQLANMSQAEPEIKIYIVKKGDTLGEIANRMKISYSEILKANSGIKPDRIYIGQKIRVPLSARN